MKLAFIVQRYGKKISGGAEEHARQLAEHLSKYHSIEIITTCAEDYNSWANTFPQGEESQNSILIHRFETDFEKNKTVFDEMTSRLLQSEHSYLDELEWLVHQGPYSENLFQFIRTNHQRYDFLIFYTYLYITTAFGLQIAPHKSLLLPTAHDEPVSHFSIFRTVFNLPRGIFYLTEEERNYVHHFFKNDYIPSTILGYGIDEPVKVNKLHFVEKFKISEPFLLYVGRIDEGKGCKELIDYFVKYKDENNSDLMLCLVGNSYMKLPSRPDIIATGFISEQEKNEAYEAALAVVSPSNYESLSINVLEAFNHSKPVIANARSEVVKGHCSHSRAGLIYNNYEEFTSQLNSLLKQPEKRKKLGQRGKKYIDEHFRWKTVLKNFNNFLLKF